MKTHHQSNFLNDFPSTAKTINTLLLSSSAVSHRDHTCQLTAMQVEDDFSMTGDPLKMGKTADMVGFACKLFVHDVVRTVPYTAPAERQSV